MLTIINVLFSIFLFFQLAIMAAILVGMKNIKFVPCAICCSIPKNVVSKNIKIVPPPHSQSANYSRNATTQNL
jgi:hypothetical protein